MRSRKPTEGRGAAFLIGAFLCLVGALPALADETSPLQEASPGQQAPSLQLSGYGKYHVFWSPEYVETTTNAFVLHPQVNVGFGEAASLTVIGDGALELGQNIGASSRLAAQIIEGYLDLRLGALDLRVGRQIVAWGQTDGWNPTDNINSTDYTVESAEIDASKLPVTALKTRYYFGESNLEAVVVPEYAAAKLPAIPLPAGLAITPSATPAAAVENATWAARLSHSWQGFDLSASYFWGWSPSPDIRMTPPVNPLDPPLLMEEYHRLRVFGADFATTRGQWSFRGEGAYFLTEDRTGTDPAIENPYWQYVLGAEYSFSDDLTIAAQLMQKIIEKFDAAVEYPPWPGMPAKEGLTTSVMVRARYNVTSSLTGDLTAVVNIPHADFFIRPELSYSPADALAFSVGALFFAGGADTEFGAMKERSQRVYGEVKYSF